MEGMAVVVMEGAPDIIILQRSPIRERTAANIGTLRSLYLALSISLPSLPSSPSLSLLLLSIFPARDVLLQFIVSRIVLIVLQIENVGETEEREEMGSCLRFVRDTIFISNAF